MLQWCEMGKGKLQLKMPWNRRRWRVGATVTAMAASLAGCLIGTGHRSVAAQMISPASMTGLPQNSPARVLAPNMLSAQAALAMVEGERDRYWLNAKDITVRSVPELFAQHQEELTRGLNYSKLIEGDPRKKEIALTFDDGPHTRYTPAAARGPEAVQRQGDVFRGGRAGREAPRPDPGGDGRRQ